MANQEQDLQAKFAEKQIRDAKQDRDSMVALLAATLYVFNDSTAPDAPSRAIDRAEAFMAEVEKRGMKMRQ